MNKRISSTIRNEVMKLLEQARKRKKIAKKELDDESLMYWSGKQIAFDQVLELMN